MSKGQRKVEWSLDLENMRVRAGQFVSEAMGEPGRKQTGDACKSSETAPRQRASQSNSPSGAPR